MKRDISPTIALLLLFRLTHIQTWGLMLGQLWRGVSFCQSVLVYLLKGMVSGTAPLLESGQVKQVLELRGGGGGGWAGGDPSFTTYFNINSFG